MEDVTRRKAVNLVQDSALFVAGSVLVYGVVYWGVPGLTAAGMDPMAAWMVLSVPCIFVPVIVGGLVVLRREHGTQRWSARLRLQRPSTWDWVWGGLGLLGVGLGSGAMFWLCATLGLDPNPPFARDLQPFTGGRLWMLGLWAVYWPINILGENLVWRGIVLPRMEVVLGEVAWVFNAILWGVFHLAFGLGNLLVLVPTLILVPLLAQRRRSTWLAVLLHAGLSGPGFVALALGLI